MRGGVVLSPDIPMHELYIAYHQDVYHLVCLLTSDPFAAEDITQDTFLKAIRKRDHFQGRSSYKTWLLSIARNTAYDYLRRKKYKTLLLKSENASKEHDNNTQSSP